MNGPEAWLERIEKRIETETAKIDTDLQQIMRQLESKANALDIINLTGRVDAHLEQPHAQKLHHEERIRDLELFQGRAEGEASSTMRSRTLLFAVLGVFVGLGGVVVAVVALATR